MATQAVDTTDAISVESLVFQGDQSERSSWKFCNSTTLPRSEVVFFPSTNFIDSHHRSSSETTFLRSTLRRDAILGVTFICCSRIYSSQSTTMNKIIFTSDRLIMSVVGPGGSWKTRLIFSMLASETFHPKFEKTYYFYKEYQPLFKEISEKLDFEFVSCLNIQMIKQLENCLHVFDDSCEEIYQEKEFVKLAVAGRPRNVHCIFVKHNLFHQSKWSRTIDLNTTHIILFKSPRDLQQIDHFGRQLKRLTFFEKPTGKQHPNPTDIYWLI